MVEYSPVSLLKLRVNYRSKLRLGIRARSETRTLFCECLAVPSGVTAILAEALSSIGRRRQGLFVVGCSSSGYKHTAQYIKTSAIHSNALWLNHYGDINARMKLI
jgi:hypothetical protein